MKINKIKNIREVMFTVTQERFAKMIGCNTATLSRWEQGHFNPNLKNITKIIALAKKKGFALSYEDII